MRSLVIRRNSAAIGASLASTAVMLNILMCKKVWMPVLTASGGVVLQTRVSPNLWQAVHQIAPPAPV